MTVQVLDKANKELMPKPLRMAAQNNDPKVVKKALRLLPEGIDLDLITAQALVGGHETIDILDQMLTMAAKRRQQAAKDIETRRLLAARTWRLEHVFPKTSSCM